MNQVYCRSPTRGLYLMMFVIDLIWRKIISYYVVFVLLSDFSLF